jgi:hypothetical protein
VTKICNASSVRSGSGALARERDRKPQGGGHSGFRCRRLAARITIAMERAHGQKARGRGGTQGGRPLSPWEASRPPAPLRRCVRPRPATATASGVRICDVRFSPPPAGHL